MGVVWRARDCILDIDVALKRISRECLGPGGFRRLLVEARAAAAIAHPSIVTVHSLGTTDCGDPYVVMEMLEGETLDQVLDREGPMEPIQAVRTMLPIIDALAIAHDRGIIHRDIKSSNILVVRESDAHWRPKLLDFGIARMLEDESNTRLTVTGHVLGTPQFMSPEQAAGRSDVDHRTDIWGVSAVLYELLGGAAPFDGDNYNAVISAVLLDAPRSLASEHGVDAELWAIVERGLAKPRDDRWSTMRVLRRVLERWLHLCGCDTDITGRTLSVPDGTGPWRIVRHEDEAGHTPPPDSTTSDPAVPYDVGRIDRALGMPLFEQDVEEHEAPPVQRAGWPNRGTWAAAALALTAPLWLLLPSEVPGAPRAELLDDDAAGSSSAAPLPSTSTPTTARGAASAIALAPSHGPASAGVSVTAAAEAPSAEAPLAASAQAPVTASAQAPVTASAEAPVTGPSVPPRPRDAANKLPRPKAGARATFRGPGGFDMPLPTDPDF